MISIFISIKAMVNIMRALLNALIFRYFLLKIISLYSIGHMDGNLILWQAVVILNAPILQ